MTVFRYEVIDTQGKRRIDAEDARNKEDLLLNLQSRGLILIRWLDDERPAGKLFQRSARTLNSRSLLQMTRDLAHLLKSELPMDRALRIIKNSATDKSVKAAAGYLNDALRKGSSLSEAMATRPDDFNGLYINMIRVGEMGGILPAVLEKLAHLMERTEEIKRFIISTSIYPTILMLIGLVSVVVIMGFVVPSFAGIFSDLGQEIPFTTRILFDLSQFLRTWWWLILAGVAGLTALGWRLATLPSGRERIDRLLLRAPFLGTLLLEIRVGRFARTLGTLVLSGVPLLKSLSIVREVVGNNLVKDAIEHIYHEVKEGKSISGLMKEKDIFPPMAVQMVSLGEETGKIGEMLLVVADELETRIQAKIKSYLAMLEPLAILMMGIIIGGIVVSMLSAIFGINEIEF